ncbi:hypothetical protein PoB_000430000 [Plakobranchus ocellatus]|uniref:Uncharacterized protein n=1 Tax=Plakobranchus ocellatus TaxID=259542 RepID=A0AAV3Y435_9GAST|nr:hypothetical protein PoB_000430000 [Plakobranchus ocellatus]
MLVKFELKLPIFWVNLTSNIACIFFLLTSPNEFRVVPLSRSIMQAVLKGPVSPDSLKPINEALSGMEKSSRHRQSFLTSPRQFLYPTPSLDKPWPLPHLNQPCESSAQGECRWHMANESALRSAGTLLSQVRAPPQVPWLDGAPKA